MNFISLDADIYGFVVMKNKTICKKDRVFSKVGR